MFTVKECSADDALRCCLESQTRNSKVASSNLVPVGFLGGGVNVQCSLHPQYHD